MRLGAYTLEAPVDGFAKITGTLAKGPEFGWELKSQHFRLPYLDTVDEMLKSADQFTQGLYGGFLVAEDEIETCQEGGESRKQRR